MKKPSLIQHLLTGSLILALSGCSFNKPVTQSKDKKTQVESEVDSLYSTLQPSPRPEPKKPEKSEAKTHRPAEDQALYSTKESATYGIVPGEKVKGMPVPKSAYKKRGAGGYVGMAARRNSAPMMMYDAIGLPQPQQFNTEAYDHISENEFLKVLDRPLSTFSIDVDTASYANMRRFLNQGSLPPKDAVRIEELINYFDYSYEKPKDNRPFTVQTEVAKAPWNGKNRLVHIGIKGLEFEKKKKPASNLVFLLDVSGSMSSQNKLPLLKASFKKLVRQLDSRDRVAIVVYAGAAGLVLPSTEGSDHRAIMNALDRLQAGGSTNGGQGIKLAYKIAQDNFIKGGVNRVILATDGDFNVGTSSRGDLVRRIEKAREKGVYLSILGFGMGNYKDARMEELSNKGNGNYAYIDTEKEAQKVLVEQMMGTLVTIAKDVKIQIEFNPYHVASYRLIGYENRMLKKEDFNNDKKDAGEIGAGHTVTAIYEIVPKGESKTKSNVDPLEYQTNKKVKHNTKDLLTVKIRYKRPDGQKSKLLKFPISPSDSNWESMSNNFKFASAVSLFGMLLRDSKFKSSGNFQMVQKLAQKGMGDDKHGYRQEFQSLVQKAAQLKGQTYVLGE